MPGSRPRLTLVKGLLIVGVLALLSLGFRSDTQSADQPLVDDGYYSLTVARNLAGGDGLTIDEHHLTNGIQPLFTFVSAIPFAIAGGDRLLGLRLFVILEVTVDVLAALSLFRLARRLSPAIWTGTDGDHQGRVYPWVTAFLFLASTFGVLTMFNGLETGFFLLSYALILLWCTSRLDGGTPIRRALELGLLLGGLVLVRADAMVFATVLCGFLALRPGRGRLVRSVVPLVVAGIVSAPWWLYNLIEFDSLVPTGGRAQMSWAISPNRVVHVVSAAAKSSVPWLYANELPAGALAFGRLVLLGAAVTWLARSRIFGRLPPVRELLTLALRSGSALGATALGLTWVLLGCWYGLSSFSTFNYERYLSFGMLLFVPLIAVAVVGVMQKAPRLGTTTLIGLLAVMLGLIGMLHTGRVLDGSTPLHDQLSLVRDHVPTEDVVAAAQTGTLGFFRDRVVNLDGKVNADALAHRHDMSGYLREVRARWFCDWPEFVLQYLGPDPAATGWRLVDHRGRFQLYRRVAGPATPVEAQPQ